MFKTLEDSMFGTLKTLINGANARAEESLRGTYAIELIDQKIREANAALSAAKNTLASLIQRSRTEARQIDTLEGRIADLMQRAQEAMDSGRTDLAEKAAQAVADLENEMTLRKATVERLDARILQLRQTVETGHRRLVDLKQGALFARAMRREQSMQRRMTRHVHGESPFEEAEALISRVMEEDDPFEQSQILREIDTGLNHGDIASQMADAGFGTHGKSTAADVLNRLKSKG
ncbi:MAG: PspA/IM30 family protein [Paracoccaceae bacterium]